MLFSDIRRQAHYGPYALSSTSAAGALTWLRRQTFPQLIEAPRFAPRSRTLAAQPALLPWLRDALGEWSAHIAAAVLAAVLIAMATALLAPGSAPGVDRSTARSSTGATGTASTHIEDLGTTTFVGQLPFVAQQRYFAALDGSLAAGQGFVQGAREASVAEYLQNVNEQVTLPYLADAAGKKQAIDTWNAAAAEAQRKAAAEAAAQAAAQAQRAAVLQSPAVWRAPALPAGTVRFATVTFYACVGSGFCGNMASGQQVFAGAAACSADMPFGTRFVVNNDPSRRVFVCLDRGALSATWVDVWFYSVAEGHAWQSRVGSSSQITVLD